RAHEPHRRRRRLHRDLLPLRARLTGDLLLSGLLEELLDAPDRAQDIFLRVGVGEPQVALAVDAEIRPTDQRDAFLLEECGSQLLGLPACLADVRKGVERTLRRDAAHAGQAVQPLDDDLAAVVEGPHHRLDRILRAVYRGNAGKLRRRVDARPAIDRELAHLVIEVAAFGRIRPDRPAQAP